MAIASGFVREWIRAATVAMTAGVMLPKQVSAQSFCRYEITAVIEGPSCGILGPALVDLLSINDLGQACGFYRHCATFDKRPFAWSEETGLVILPLPEGATSGEAVDINNVLGSDGLGQVVCTLLGPGLGSGRAYLYDDGAWTLLPPGEGGNYSEAHAINDRSQVSGNRTTPSGVLGFRWEDAVFIDFDSPIGGAALGLDINANGDIAGQLFGPDHAFRWDGKVVDDLNPLLGTQTSTARAINSRDGIVGGASIAVRDESRIAEAYFLQDKSVDYLGIPTGFDHTVALDMNNADQVLVLAQRNEPFVLKVVHLWQHGEMVPVEELVEPLDGVNFGGAIIRAINNNGKIGAVAGIGGSNAGVILTPIDRPLGDVNFDCAVDDHDLTAVLRDWGPCPEVGSCICDIVTSETFQPPGDGKVDGADLAVVLGNWTRLTKVPAANRR